MHFLLSYSLLNVFPVRTES